MKPNLQIANLKAASFKVPRFKIPSKGEPADAAAKRKPAGKLLKASPSSKFVLFIGDEGAILVYIKENTVQSRQFVSDGDANNLQELKTSLAQDTKAPVLLVIDSMDQSYVQQTLPPVSPLSINKLIKRRLDRDFGANDIKGAIVLGREKSGRKDWNFLMVALEKSPQLSIWIDFVSELPNRFQGIYLVSVEAEMIVKNLERAMGVPKEGTGSEWKFFVSHNKVGGFRQVILRNGRLIFTRMAQPIGESTPEVIAGNIEQEMLSTIEYMRRLSFTPQAGLDIYIIASAALKPLIDPSKFEASAMHILTPYETAQYLGIEGATQPADQFGDVILAASIGCSRKHVLTLTTPQSRQFDKLYQLMLYQRAAAALVGLGIILYAGNLTYGVYGTFAKNEELEHTRASRQKSLESLREEIKKSNLDVEKTGDLIDLYQQLQKEKFTPLPFISKIGAIIKPPIVVKAVSWSVEDKPAGPIAKMTAVFTLEFPGVGSLDAFKVVSKKVQTDLREAFKGYDVAYTKVPPKFSESEKLDMTFNNNQPAAEAGDSGQSEVELTIKGDVMAPSTASQPTPSP